MNYSGSNPLNPFADFVDEHTVLFYPLDDGTIPYGSPTASMGFAGQPNSQMFDSINNIEINATIWNYYNKSVNTPTPDMGKGCCFYSSTTGGGHLLSTTGDTIPLTVVSAARDSWTWMGWFMPMSQSFSSGRMANIFCFTGNATGTDESRNSLFHIGYYRNEESNEHAGKIHVGWHHGQVTGSSVVSSNKHLPPSTYGRWQHLAVTKEVSGSNAIVKIYVNGTAVSLANTANTSSILVNATGGDSNVRQFGISNGVGAAPYAATGSVGAAIGAVWHIQWDSVVRSDEFIYSASQDPYMSTTDGNTFIYWDLECLPDFRDYGPYGIHMHKADNSNTSNPTRRTNNSLYPMNYGLQTLNGTSALSNLDLSNIKLQSGLDLAAVLTGSWTIEFLSNATNYTSTLTDMALAYCGYKNKTTTGGSESDNNLVCWYIDGTTSSMKFSSHSGSGVIHDEYLWSESNIKHWSSETYWALTKEVLSGGLSASYILYKNGEEVYQFRCPNATLSYPNYNMRYQIFRIFTDTNSGGYYNFRLADHKLSNIARNAQYFRENFEKYYRNSKNLRLYQNILSSSITYTTGSPDSSAIITSKMGEKYP